MGLILVRSSQTGARTDVVDLDVDGMLIFKLRAEINSICGWGLCVSGSGQGPVAETDRKVKKPRTPDAWYSGEFLDELRE
jgi:hypothetical protein